MIWCLQYGSSDGRVPLSIVKFGWSQKNRSIHEGAEFTCKLVGSDISRGSPRLDVRLSIATLLFKSPSGHHYLQ